VANEQVTLSANETSPVGSSRVDFLVNAAMVATSISSPFTATWDSSTVGDGPVTVNARATGAGGNQTTSAGVSVTACNAASRGNAVC
jgi:hypothetical protein